MSDHGSQVEPGPIMELATRYWESRCFLTANDLGLFEVLGEGPGSVEEIADSLGLAVRPARLLLNACVGLGLLEGRSGSYENTPATQTFLVSSSPAYLGNAIRYSSDMWEAWSRLHDALRSGVPPLKPESYTGEDPERTRNFVLGMHGRAMGIGAALIPMVDLSGRHRLLDVGGGPGTYAALFSRAYPELRATVLDLPAVVEIAKEVLAGLGVEDRVDTLAGDFHDTPFPGGNDAVLFSGVFHREGEAACRELIGRARDALRPGGLLIVSDVLTDAGGATPAFSALFGLNMMLSAPEGGVHADADVADWMRECGFHEVELRHFPPPMPHRVVLGSLRARR